MNKKLPVYNVVIDESKQSETGVDYVALVDAPAVDVDFMVFSKPSDKLIFVADKKRWIVTGVLMRADYNIYRSDDKRGEYYVRFSKEEIEKIVKKFAKQNFYNNVNIMHNGNAIVDGVTMIESILVDKQRGVSSPKGLNVEDGSWIASYYVENPEIRTAIENGTFKGFSVEGLFGYDFTKTDPIQDLFDFLNKQL